MSIAAVLLPLFVQVALTFVLLLWMAGLNASATRSGEVSWQDIALREPNWPARNMQIRNAFLNQLETPVLFYVLTVLAWITRHADYLFVVLAWIFVALRIVHAFIHVADNNVPRRGAVFLASMVVLAVMWVIFAFRILLGLG
jgi:hypothetical protein